MTDGREDLDNRVVSEEPETTARVQAFFVVSRLEGELVSSWPPGARCDGALLAAHLARWSEAGRGALDALLGAAPAGERREPMTILELPRGLLVCLPLDHELIAAIAFFEPAPMAVLRAEAERLLSRLRAGSAGGVAPGGGHPVESPPASASDDAVDGLGRLARLLDTFRETVPEPEAALERLARRADVPLHILKQPERLRSEEALRVEAALHLALRG